MAKEDQILDKLIELASDMRVVHEKLMVIEKWMLAKDRECQGHQEQTAKLEKTLDEKKAAEAAISGLTAKIVVLTTLTCTVLTLVLKLTHVI